MSIEEALLDDFDNYLRGAMSSEQKSNFLRKLEKDENLMSEFQAYKDIQDVLENRSNIVTKSMLQSREEKTPETNASKSKTSKNYKWIGFVAGLMLLAGIFYWSSTKNSGSESTLKYLYAANFTPYPNDYVKIERGDGELTDIKRIFIAYGSKDYEKVIRSIDIYNKELGDPQLEFYKAVSLMATDQNLASLDLLERLKQNKNLSLDNQISWYIALNALKLKDVPKAKKYLQAIVNSKDTYRKTSAKELLEQL